MKILHVIPSLALGFGGPSVVAISLCRALSHYGHEVAIFTTDADIKGRLKVDLNVSQDINGIKVFYFPVKLLKKYKFSLSLARALKEKIPYFDIIHIHSLFQFSTLIASRYCQRYHKPYIIRPLGHLDPFIFKKNRFIKYFYFRLFEAKSLKRASLLHFTTENEMHLSKYPGLDVPAIVIPLGIDLEEFRHLPEYGVFRLRYPELKGKKIILFLSRISFKKGLDILAEVFINLAKTRPDVHLVIAGPDNEGYGSKVRNWLKNSGVIDRVTFTGMLLGQDKLAAFRDSDIFVLPSYSENFGLVVIEALACGLGTVLSNKIGISREIEQNKAGIVVDANAESVYNGVKLLLDNPQLKEEMAMQGRKLVRECYDIDKIAEKMTKVYEEVLVK